MEVVNQQVAVRFVFVYPFPPKVLFVKMCDIKIEDLVNEYEFLGIKPTTAVLETSMQICKKYNMSAEDFLSQWSAYTLNNNLKGTAPDVDSLQFLDRKVLSVEFKTTVFPDHTPKKQLENVITPQKSGVAAKNDKKRARSPPSESQTPIRQTLENTVTKALNDSLYLEGPTYSERTDIGRVQITFGKFKKTTFNFTPSIKLLDGWNFMTENVKFMYEILPLKAGALKSISDCCCVSLLEKYNLEIKYGTNKAGDICICGRVLHHGEGKLNKYSITVHFLYDKYDAVIEMNAAKLESFSLYPGQVIAAAGNLTSENKFTAINIYSRNFPPRSSISCTLTDSLNVIVAAGPFTTLDNLQHEPLQDLLKYVLTEQPHVLILIGPFMIAEHTEINNVPTSYQEFFEQVVETIMSHLVDTNIQVVLISSHADLHHTTVYPTHPYSLTNDFDNLHRLPDPCTFDIDGVLFSITAVDILMHLGMSECSESSVVSRTGDRFQRLLGHMLDQRCFYPLYPAARDVPVDYTLLEKYGRLDVMPDVLIVPSKFSAFVKKVDSCIAINPERLTKFRSGGTFARIQVSPAKDSSCLREVACEIIKI